MEPIMRCSFLASHDHPSSHLRRRSHKFIESPKTYKLQTGGWRVGCRNISWEKWIGTVLPPVECNLHYYGYLNWAAMWVVFLWLFTVVLICFKPFLDRSISTSRTVRMSSGFNQYETTFSTLDLVQLLEPPLKYAYSDSSSVVLVLC